MKHFQIVRKNFALLGINANQSRFNHKSAFAFSIYSLNVTLCGAFLFSDDNTFLEYTMNVFITTSIITAWVDFLVIFLQKDKIFKMMFEFEEYYDKSGYIWSTTSQMLFFRNKFGNHLIIVNSRSERRL